MVWDAMKAVIRGRAISITAHYKKEKQNHGEELLFSIKRLEQFHKKLCNPRIYKQFLTERKKLEALEVSLIQQNLLYLKQRYWLCRPKQLKLIAWKVKQCRTAQHIPAIRNHSETQVTRSSEILGVFIPSCIPNFGRITPSCIHLPTPTLVISGPSSRN